MKTKSILTKYDKICALCRRTATEEHHLLSGSNREKAEHDGIKIPICRDCHNFIHMNPVADQLAKICGQLAYEKYVASCYYTDDEAETREIFRKRYGKSYL